MKYTGTEDDARKTIMDDIASNMFVEAGAGAGKTFLIVERITHMLKNGYRPKDIVAITFTNAAAEELRGRIARRVRKEGLKDALLELDEMNISTIHSFCNVLLKEQAVTAGLPVDLTIIDEKEERHIQQKCFNDYLKDIDNNEWDRLEKMSGKERSRWSIRTTMEEIYQNVIKQPEDVVIHTEDGKRIASLRAQLSALTEAKSDAKRIERVDGIRDRILETANSLINKAEKKHSDFASLLGEDRLTSKFFRDNMKKMFGGAIDYAATDEWFYDNRGKMSLFVKTGLTVAYNKDGVDAANSSIISFVTDQYRWREKFDELMEYDWYMALVEHALNAAKRYRSSIPSDTISNDRLLFLTKKMICNDADERAYRYFASKYKAYFVDEFQDTDSIQAGFIYRLASDPDDPGHEKLRDGALFVVGDPKQSIYRFRGAQPEVYFDIKEKMVGLSNAKVFELQKNFRTNETLIEWINDKFEEADGMRGNTDPENIMYIVDKNHPYLRMMPDKKVAQSEDKLLAGAYKVGTADSFKGTSPDKPDIIDYSVDQDVADVVALIKNLVDGGYKITDYDGDRNPFSRNIKYSDILIMTHKKDDMGRYLSELKRNGISVRFDGESSLGDDLILNVYVRIFKHLINPKDRFFRVAAKEAIRRTRLTVNENEMDTFSDYLLDSLRKGSEKMTPFGVARYLENQLSALVVKDSVLSYIDLNTSMTKIRQMLEYLCKNERGNGMSMIKAMEEYVQNGVEHELSLEEGSDESIRFMNLHKTKGLEGKIVIIANRKTMLWDTKVGSYRNGDDYYPGTREWGIAGYDGKLSEKAVAESKAEFHRLEYVAVTRAEQAVIFMNTIGSGCIFANRKYTKKNGMADGFDYKLRDLGSLRDVISSKEVKPRTLNAGLPYDVSSDHYTHPETQDSDPRKQSIYIKQSPSELETKDQDRVIKKSLEKEISESGVDPDSLKSSAMKRPADNHVGNVLHRTMELLVKRYVAANVQNSCDIVKSSVGQALYELRDEITGRKEYTADEVREFITQCAMSYYEWLKQDPEGVLSGVKKTYTELPFSYYDNETNVFMKGNADLIFTKDDGSAVLIDYKSDKDELLPDDRMPDVLKEKYAPQLTAYKETIERLLKIPKDRIKTFIISFSQKDENDVFYSDKTVRVRCTPIRTDLS